MHLILARHGRTSANTSFLLDTAAPGADLDETGRQQAIDLIPKLAPYPIQAVFASNLSRTQQTAAPLAAHLGLEVQILPGLREVSAGEDEMSADGQRYMQMLLAWKAGHLEQAIPGGESGEQFLARYDAAISQIVNAGYETAAVFSHGAGLRTWCSARINGFSQALGNGVFDNTGFVVASGSVTNGWEVVEMAGTRTLSGYWDDAFVSDAKSTPVATTKDSQS